MLRLLTSAFALGAMLTTCYWVFPARGLQRAPQALGLASPGHLRDIVALSETEAWAVSERGFTLHTTDGGATWAHRWLGVEPPLRALAFADARRGCIVGHRGAVFVTDDGGENWRRARTPTHNHLTDVCFIGETGLALGYWGTVLRTADGGQSWRSRQVAVDKPLEGVFFITPEVGWAVGWAGIILHTADAGRTWRRQATPRAARTLNAVYFRDARRGWAVGSFGCILHTADGGATWKQQPSPLADRFTDIVFTAGGRGIIAGINSMLVSDDGGATWQRDEFNLAEPVQALAVCGRRLWRAGGGEVAVSADDGRSWAATRVTVRDGAVTVAR